MANKRRNGQSGLADPTKLKPFKKKGELLKVVVETPKGSRNKYAFDPDEKVFTLKRVLPEGMVFPYDFGFVPQTEADDGDPVDVLLLMEEPVFPGCIALCRLVGVIEGEETEQDGSKERNDRLVAVEQGCRVYSEIKDVNELPDKLVKQIGDFFVTYNRLDGKKFRVLGIKGPDVARRMIDKQRVAA
jgi:inorganic pyrophosphatase